MLAAVIDHKLNSGTRTLGYSSLHSSRIAITSIAIWYALMCNWMRILRSMFITFHCEDLRASLEFSVTAASARILAREGLYVYR